MTEDQFRDKIDGIIREARQCQAAFEVCSIKHQLVCLVVLRDRAIKVKRCRDGSDHEKSAGVTIALHTAIRHLNDCVVSMEAALAVAEQTVAMLPSLQTSEHYDQFSHLTH